MFSNGIDQIEADEQLATGTTLWALTDHLGSVRDVVDNSGAVQNHIVYDAFGNITSQTNSSVIFRNSYTGQEFDSESGLFSYGGRYYDPFNGKFIQEDKIGFEGGDTNLSRYVFNSPVIYNDPSGNIAQAVVIPAAVIIGGALILLDSINRAIEVNQRGSRTIPLVPTLDPPPIRKPDTTPTPSPQPAEERRKAPPDPNKCKNCKQKYPNLSLLSELPLTRGADRLTGYTFEKLDLALGDIRRARSARVSGSSGYDKEWWKLPARPEPPEPARYGTLLGGMHINVVDPTNNWKYLSTKPSSSLASIGKYDVCDEKTTQQVTRFAILNLKNRYFRTEARLFP
jgi:RHS repeat-associated protein